MTPTADTLIRGRSLQRARKRMGWKQDQLAHAIGVSRALIAQYETGRCDFALRQRKIEAVLGPIWVSSGKDCQECARLRGVIERMHAMAEAGMTAIGQRVDALEALNGSGR